MTTESPTWGSYDHLTMAAMADPATYLAALRTECPVGHSDLYGGFHILTRYADCVDQSRDPRLSSMPEKGPSIGFPFSGQPTLREPMIMDDGDRHRAFRMPLQRIFTPRMARSLEPQIRAICDRLIDVFIETGNADLADQFSIEVPAILIADLYDLPQHRRREFQALAASIVADHSAEAMARMEQLTIELYDLRRANPGSDILSQALDLEIEGQPITRDDWRGLVMLLILAGLDTTANAGSYIFHHIGQHPEIRHYLLDDPGRIRGAIDEFIRLISPVPQHSRGVTEDMAIDGHCLRAGDAVQLNWLAANHDPAVFDDPEVFRPNRTGRHLGFGSGPHLCLGRHVALVELEVMVERILARLPDFALVDGGIARVKSLSRQVNHLPVTFTPGRKLAA